MRTTLLAAALLMPSLSSVAQSAERSPWATGTPVIEADRAFARLADEKGAAAAFEVWLAPDARHVQPGGTVVGREKIVEGIRAWVGSGTLKWTPREGQVARSGDLGFTWGTSELQLPGQPLRTGFYVTVWRKQKDGSWRAIVDTGGLDPRPAPE